MIFFFFFLISRRYGTRLFSAMGQNARIRFGYSYKIFCQFTRGGGGKIPRTCHNLEAQFSRGTIRKRDEEQITTRQTPHVKPQTYNHQICRPRWLSWMRRPTGDQEVAVSTPAEVGNILSWRLIMKYFLRSFSPFRWFKKGSCQFLAKECAQYWLTA